MKRLIPLLLISLVLLFFSVISANAESEFEMYLSDFYQKQEKASKILKEIETDLILAACSGSPYNIAYK